MAEIEWFLSNFFDYINQKGEAYTNIDIERFPRFWQKYNNLFKLPKTIQLIGTNGKGSTGRFLANFLSKKGYKVLHYTSPHILEVNERFWIDGVNIESKKLQQIHLELLDLINKSDLDALSYFEYLTLIAAKLAQSCDYFVCEAGLGGEFDATTSLKCDLLLVTTIDLDHQNFLGNSITEIATTKLRAIRSSTILGVQKHSEVYEIAEKIANKRGEKLIKIKSDALGFEANRQLALAATKELGFNVAVEDLNSPLPFGRLSQIAKNIYIDVGHNTLAATHIARHFADKKVVLFYNSYFDKDFYGILELLKPIIKRVVIYKIVSNRAAKTEEIEIALKQLNIDYSYDASLNDKEIFLVFGSFSVVEAFLKSYNEK